MTVADAKKAVREAGFAWDGVRNWGSAMQPRWIASADWEPVGSRSLREHDYIECGFLGATRSEAMERLVAFCKQNKKPKAKGDEDR